MTSVMQSSTAAIAVTLSAFYAGAVGLDQGCALIIGQNIGTATSSALAAIGASTTAKRLALAYVLFKIIAALIALALFPITMPLILRASGALDGVTLLAAYHTAYNVVGVAVLMPVLDWFTRFVERLLPDSRSPLTSGLDPAALESPVVAVEAVRRTMALAIGTMGPAIAGLVSGEGKAAAGVALASPRDALHQARNFLSDVSGPPDSESEELRLTSTLHALDHVSRLAELAGEEPDSAMAQAGPDEVRAAALCAEAMRAAVAAVREIAQEAALSDCAAPIAALETPDSGAALAKLEEAATNLAELRRSHRGPTLAKVGAGEITADQAMGRIESVRRLENLARHAWRGVAHLLGEAEVERP
jgi:phosphate:Na+ symporter